MKPEDIRMPSLSAPPGMSGHELSSTWRSMLSRCFNPKHPKFKEYGGRNIRVCDRWIEEEPKGQGFLNFLEDVGSRPPGKTLDRRDNDKGYSKQNCYWATTRQQNLSKRYRRKGVLQESRQPWKQARTYIVLVGSNVLIGPDDRPLVTQDIRWARHLAKVNSGRYVDLRVFLNSKKAA